MANKSYMEGRFWLAEKLAKDMPIPKQLYKNIQQHLTQMQDAWFLEKNDRNGYYIIKNVFQGLDFRGTIEVKREMSNLIETHESLINELWEDLKRISEEGSECIGNIDAYTVLTVEESKEVLAQMSKINFPMEYWSEDFYVAKMNDFAYILKGDTNLGFHFNGGRGKLTQAQAESVVWAMEIFLGINTEFAFPNISVPSNAEEFVSEDRLNHCEKCGKSFDLDRQFYCNKRNCEI